MEPVATSKQWNFSWKNAGNEGAHMEKPERRQMKRLLKRVQKKPIWSSGPVFPTLRLAPPAPSPIASEQNLKK